MQKYDVVNSETVTFRLCFRASYTDEQCGPRAGLLLIVHQNKMLILFDFFLVEMFN